MRIVFDTNALLSATLWEGSVAQKLLFKAIRSGIAICCSTDILSEYQRVLQRDFDYSDEELIRIMEKVFSFVTLVTPTQKVHAVEEDPDDDKIIECAIAGSCGYVITYDKHLLKLREFRGIRVMTPEEALRTL
jgi:putative PIN family toxin of toxin-antitoxin system